MASGSSVDNGIIVGINVTPMVDITLVLLIIFMVTAKILVAPAVPLDLPRAESVENVKTILGVTVPKVGPTLVNGEPVASNEALVGLARAALGKDGDVRAVINADGSATHRQVMEVVDALKRGGINRLAFGALPPGEMQ